jgi:transcriptional antiterminator NusG
MTMTQWTDMDDDSLGNGVKEWFIVHTYSGFEKKVMDSLRQRAEVEGIDSKVGEILIPIESVVEMRGGKKVVTSKKSYPGYIFVELDWGTDVYYLVKQTPKVTGFVGISSNKKGLPQKPPAVPADEVDRIRRQAEETQEEPKPKFTFEKGETVRITEGPFNSFQGKVEEINEDKNTLKVMVTIFGRATPVELEFLHVEKI